MDLTSDSYEEYGELHYGPAAYKITGSRYDGFDAEATEKRAVEYRAQRAEFVRRNDLTHTNGKLNLSHKATLLMLGFDSLEDFLSAMNTGRVEYRLFAGEGPIVIRATKKP